MSGPKVVRIVTREEAEALCRQDIAVFAAASAELLRAAGSLESAQGLRAELEKRRQQLEQGLAAGRFLEVQEQATKSAAFLRLEAKTVAAAALAGARSLRQRRRSLAEAAASVARAYPQTADAMRELARRAMTAPEEALGVEQQALDRAWRAQLRPSSAEPSAEQRELAARLGAGEETATLDGWLAARAVAAKPRELRIDGALAELEALAGEAAARVFVSRAAALLGESEARQELLADSLLLDLGAELRRMREEAALRERLVAARARLAAAGAGAGDLTARLEAELASPHGAVAEPLLREVEQALAASLATKAADARRQAVLEALATLGYEVRENLATAWVEGGRIVVKKPGAQDYGVELGAPADASRLQVRLVGAAEPQEARSASRDRDQETIFCGEVDRLKELVAAQSGELVVEKALPAGAAPVKTVAFPEAERREIEAPRLRTLRPGG